MTFGSLFSGIGGFDLGLERAGMRCAWQVEIDRHCLKLLASRWPGVERFTDVRTVGTDLAPVDLVCGGFPCQDLSVAGRRAGLDGERSGLWYECHRVLASTRPRWCIIENVPGLLSSAEGRDFATIVLGLVELGYGVAWRILDAQFAGLAQRRDRVFIVGSLGDGSCVPVLFEPESVRWDPAPRRQARAEPAATPRGGVEGRGEPDMIAATLRAGGTATLPSSMGGAGIVPDVAWALQERDAKGPDSDTKDRHLIAVGENGRALSGGGGKPGQRYPAALTGIGVRRLTPRECERLQGFPDDWTAGFSDYTRYRMLGNAVAVPVAAWIGKRVMAASAT